MLYIDNSLISFLLISFLSLPLEYVHNIYILYLNLISLIYTIVKIIPFKEIKVILYKSMFFQYILLKHQKNLPE